MHRLGNADLPLDDAGSDLFNGIHNVRFDRPFAIDGFPKRVNNASKQTFADRNLEEASSGFDLITFGNLSSIAKQNATDFRFFKIQRQPELPVGKFDQLIEHHVAQAFDFCDAITDLADDSGVRFNGRRLQTGDLRFEFL